MKAHEMFDLIPEALALGFDALASRERGTTTSPAVRPVAAKG